MLVYSFSWLYKRLYLHFVIAAYWESYFTKYLGFVPPLRMISIRRRRIAYNLNQSQVLVGAGPEPSVVLDNIQHPLNCIQYI